MLRIAIGTFLMAALLVALPAGSALAAPASEDQCWVPDNTTVGGKTIQKALDFCVNPAPAGDGKVYCATGTCEKDANNVYSDVFYTRTPATQGDPNPNAAAAKTVWAGPYFLRNNNGGVGNNQMGSEMVPTSTPAVPHGRPRVLPLLVPFSGSVYAARLYKLKFDNDASAAVSAIFWWEWRVLNLTSSIPVATVANTTEPPVLQVRGAYDGASTPSVANTHLVDGYLFQDGTNLYWGGGGGTAFGDGGVLPAVQNSWATVDKVGVKEKTTFNYVYKFDGAAWSAVARGVSTPAGGFTDPTTIPISKVPQNSTYKIPQAMPNGYRMSHLIAFKGIFWDYYGSYGAGPNFSFTPYDPAAVPFTEPWGKFQMGTDGINLFRVAFNRKGDKNFVCYNAGGGTNVWVTSGGMANFFKAGINDGVTSHFFADTTPNAAAPYWRACAAINDVEKGAVSDPVHNPDGYIGNPLHNGVYCTYSRQTGANTWESGVYRYFPTDGSEFNLKDYTATPQPRTRTPGWRKVVWSNDARAFTGAIFVNSRDGIYVGTNSGIYRRGIRNQLEFTAPARDATKDDPGDPDPLAGSP